MDPMLEAFISESRDNLETAGRCFLELEKCSGDEGLLNDLFRSVHTIKGSSGLFDIPVFTKVVHAAEDVLDSVRSGELLMTPEHIDMFLDTMDQVSVWLDDLESTGSLGDGAEARSQVLVQDLRALLSAPPTVGSDPNVTEPEDLSQPQDAPDTGGRLCTPPGWLAAMPDKLRLALYARTGGESLDILAIEYTPDSQCFFSGEDPLHIVRTLPGMVWFHIQARDSWLEPVEMDPYQCNLVFHAVAAGTDNEIRHHLRYVNEWVHVMLLAPDQLVVPEGEFGDSEPFETFIEESTQLIEEGGWRRLRQRIHPLLEVSEPGFLQTSVLHWMETLLKEDEPNQALLESLLETLRSGVFQWPEEMFDPVTQDNTPSLVEDGTSVSMHELDEPRLAAVRQALVVQRHILSMPCSYELLAGRIASVAKVVKNLLAASESHPAGLDAAIETALDEKSPEPLVAFVDDLLSAMKPDGKKPASGPEDKPMQREEVRHQDVSGQQVGGSDGEICPRMGAMPKQMSTSAGEPPARSKTLRVDQQRIDALMDLVGELVVAKNAMPFLARRAENDFGIRLLAKEIKAQYAVINRLAEELQGAVMQIRMIPVSSVFQRFPRLVRDLSRKLGKQIRLVLEGEETEADKNVVENLADPLIHLVRNSLDHGLETAQERESAGKPAEGTIILRAISHDDQVIIEVVDNGRGIDPEVIKRKAYGKGVIDEQRLDTITDHEALQLIFAAGFSTAEEVSDLSGRGVGMDVVRSVVMQAGGRVSVESKKGEGTTIRLSLPLSMAVTRVMMVEVAGQCYGVAMENIVETVRVPTTDIQRIKHNEAVVLRDKIIPLFYLSKLLNLKVNTASSGEVAILLMKVAGQEVGLVIDEFHEGLDIIQKPLEGVLVHYPWYAGAALLGDGRVLLVLNIRELLSCR